MIEELRRLPGGATLDSLVDELAEGNPSVAVRLNRRKSSLRPGGTVGLKAELEAEFGNLSPVAWNDSGFYIGGERPRFTFDPRLHQGLYYVQDPSSMAVATVVGRLTEGRGPLTVIDGSLTV